jgi:inosose dehydratase
MRLRLASAPVTWGVWERTVEGPDLIPPDRMLEAVRGLGYTGIELGPPGYFGLSGEEVGSALAAHGLELVGGFAPLHLADEDAFRADVPVWLDPVIETLAATGARGPVVLADAETDERIAVSGRPADLARTALDADAFARALERVNEAVERCRSRGVDVVFHHHSATYVESEDELERFLAGTDVGICFDTGHALVGGIDPVEGLRMCGPRTRHLHLKDVDGELLGRVRSGELGMEEAWGAGIFCPFGEGEVDFAAVLATPELEDFRGWAVLEQDRVAVRAADLEQVRAVEEANLAVLRAAQARA